MGNVNVTDTPKMPEQLAEELRKKNIDDYKIISVNAAKGRYNLLASVQDGSSLFIKYNDVNAAGWNSFQKEKGIYRFLKGETSIPTVIYNEKNILAMEYIEDSCTLREWLLDNENAKAFSCLIRSALEKYRSFLVKLNEYPGEMGTFEADSELISFLAKLLLSGPYGSKVYRVERFRNRCLYHLFRWTYASRIKLSHNAYAIHGDFHINNILVNDGEAYIIDLENVVRGNAAAELAYCYVQIWVLIHNNRDLLHVLEKEIRSIFDMEMLDEREFYAIVKLYQRAILLNRRFRT